MAEFRRPDPLIFEGNVSENWRRFEQDLEIFVQAAHGSKTAKEHAYILLNIAGKDAIEKSRSFTYKAAVLGEDGQVITPAESKEDPEVLKTKFRELCSPQKNVIIERHRFNSRHQRQGESFQSFAAELKTLAKNCEFDKLTPDELVRDRIVCGVNSDALRRSLLKEKNLTLEKAVQMGQINEMTDAHSKTLKATAAYSESTDAVHAIYNKKKQRATQNASSNNYRKARVNNTPNSTPPKQINNCKNCGSSHPNGQCKALGQQCHFCKKPNHFKQMCRSRRRQQARPTQHGQRSLHELDVDETDDTEYVIESINCPQFGPEVIYTNLQVNGHVVNIKVDSGAKCSVMPLTLLQKIQCDQYLNTQNRPTLQAYGGSSIKTSGVATLECISAGKSYDIEFKVVTASTVPILGCADSLRMDLISLNENVVHVVDTPPELEKYADLFDNNIGCLPVKYKMKLDPSVLPVIRPPRKVPKPMEEKVKKELKRMTKLGVITPMEEPTEWVSHMVATKKKGTDDIRLCIDPKDLNTALKRPHHPMRTVEETTMNLANATVFTVLDAKTSFWQVPLDEQSSKLTTFHTPLGRYRYLRMPYGISSGSEVFQRTMETLFEGYPCEIIVDDLLVAGKDLEEHDEKLEKVMKRVREVGLKLNKAKCRFRQSQVSYVGHLITDKGIKPDPEKVTAITEIPVPEGTADLQRFLGMANYVSKFIENFSEVSAPLRQLLHKDVQFSWQPEHQKAFDELKKKLISPPVLAFYDVNKPLTLTCDASQFGLGCACIQDDRPIAFASCTMTETERNYAQIEKELLSITFACRKFHQYIYGKHITIETDHQPLVTILKKPLCKAPARLQKMMLRLQRYDFELHYKRGAELYLADTLSRAPRTRMENTKFEYEVMEISSSRMSDSRKEELIKETAKDPVMQRLIDTVHRGWPKTHSACAPETSSYFPFRDEIVVDDGIVMKGEKAVIPESLRAEYAKILHRGHLGIEATKRRARDVVYWPGMKSDLERHVMECSICNALKNHLQQEPLLLHNIPDLPWSIVATDLFEWNNMHYIVIVDSYSGWYEINSLQDMRSETIITKLKRSFTVHGSPQLLISDNGGQFSSAQFQRFAQEWNFHHITSSPEYPQSNGLAENSVKQAKLLLEKTKREGSDIYMNLLNVRNVPRDTVLGSPAQRLMSRSTRTPMYTNSKLLKPTVIQPKTIKNQLDKKRNQQKASYDKHAKVLKPLVVNQPVRIQTNHGFNRTGIVKQVGPQPRSYIISSQGQELRRNRKHLLPVPEHVHVPRQQRNITLPELQPDLPEQPGVTATQPATVQHGQQRQPEQQKTQQAPQQTVQQAPQQTVQPSPVKTRCGRTVKPNPKYSTEVYDRT